MGLIVKIDKKINLVIPIERDVEEGQLPKTIYIHSTPIGREVFENYFLVISKTFAAIYSEGLNIIAGPRIAALMLKKIATDLGEWDGDDGVAKGLMGEIHRLSNVIVKAESGWETLPLESAASRGLLDEEELLEAEGQIVFFICNLAMHRKSVGISVMESAAGVWGSEISLLNSTAFARSLPILTEIVNTGEKEALLSIPS